MAGPPGQVIRGPPKYYMKFGDPESKAHGEADHAGMGSYLHLLSPFVIIAQIYMKIFSQQEFGAQNHMSHQVVCEAVKSTSLLNAFCKREILILLGVAQVPPFQMLEGDSKTKRRMSQSLGNTCLYLKG